MKILRRTGLLGERDPRRRGKMTGKGKSAREEESSSDSDDDVDVVAAAPTGYRVSFYLCLRRCPVLTQRANCVVLRSRR